MPATKVVALGARERTYGAEEGPVIGTPQLCFSELIEQALDGLRWTDRNERARPLLPFRHAGDHEPLITVFSQLLGVNLFPRGCFAL